MSTRKAVIERVAANAAELRTLGARSQALFGSLARDEARPDSGADLLVDLDQHTFDRYTTLKLKLEDLPGRHADLVPIEKLKLRVRDQIPRVAIRAA